MCYLARDTVTAELAVRKACLQQKHNPGSVMGIEPGPQAYPGGAIP